jgi:hypothetical protein
LMVADVSVSTHYGDAALVFTGIET